jgi:hypothetical protein
MLPGDLKMSEAAQTYAEATAEGAARSADLILITATK